MSFGQIKEILFIVLSIGPGIILIFLGLRFLVDTDDFNLRKVYRAFTGRRQWRRFTRLVGLMCLIAGVLLCYLFLWPRLESILS